MDTLLLTDKPITARDLMNREHGLKPQKHKPRVHNQTIKKRKGVKPGFKQRGNMVYLHRLPNNNPSNSGEQMNLVPGEVKLKTKIRRITPQTELDNMDRKPQPYRLKKN